MKNIGKDLARQGKKLGMCLEYYKQVKETEEKGKLIGLYVSPKGLEFCLKNDIPTQDYIRNNFKGSIEDFGVHIDEEIKTENKRKLVLLGTCTGIVEIKDFNVCELFIKHDSEIVLCAHDYAFVVVEMYENANLTVIAGDNAKVCIYRYGGLNKVQFEQHQNSTVKIIDKNK